MMPYLNKRIYYGRERNEGKRIGEMKKELRGERITEISSHRVAARK
tara:strand:+ start:1271 stop:1408 length:138 start_codon:yes stop_codon:yes gene_type:complete